MKPTIKVSRDGRILVIEVDNPPVNALSLSVRRGLVEAIREAHNDATVEALVICAAGRTFVAGGDITEFDEPVFPEPHPNVMHDAMEALNRPIIAALHGTVLGGGLEFALAAHCRIALETTRFGLPEVTLGILPGAGGTQRLPRLAGMRAALDIMTIGKPISAGEALKLGIVDAVVTEGVREAALAMARRMVTKARPLRVTSRLGIDAASVPPSFFDEYRRKLAPVARGGRAAHEIVRCVEASLTLPFAQALSQERAAFEALRQSDESKALRHVFFAEREAARIPNLPPDVTLRQVAKVGVLGAGTMGGGIAMNFANAGIPTVLVDTSQAALDRGLGLIRSNYEASAAKGRITLQQVEHCMGLLSSGLDDSAFADCDLVIEAVFENMELKKQVCARLGKVCKPGAILATNTSTLDVDVLAQASGRPLDVIGMHFFSPANVMRLLEVVRGAQTSLDVLATVMQLAKRIGKVAVVSGVCYGFIGNRMAEVYMREAEFLMMEGAKLSQIDAAVEALGMAMGPCRMLDMAGIDVGAKTVIEYGKAGGLPPDDSYRAVVRKMFELGRFGQKTGAGYYRYEGRKPVDDPETARIANELADEHGIVQRSDIGAEEIVERLLYPLINEATKILEEGIAYRPGDIDIVWTAGYGFPAWRGGPLFMADQIGLSKIVERLKHLGQTRGNPYGYWNVSSLLANLALQGRPVSGLRDQPKT